ncbi:hypothetical protein BDV26DRAFT_282127 [Aspergillus bertholletiae]|uniref:Uncharacterized protein n=1 Tax=Aspergillus bertholletiae TaxID=1226010 RepID=A0A5N7B4Q2_9EURO|nr:hypothetical protein BDV26DRAFT_282127 [Aspergillus bertholletiae]
MSEQLIPWLNGHLDLCLTCMFSRTDVVAILNDIVTFPHTHGAPPQNVDTLSSIHQDIIPARMVKTTSPPTPPQNIDRQPNPRWLRAIARFQLRKSTYEGIKCCALPDLLGPFLSSSGQAPTGATKRNFYLPVTAVFGQWCAKLTREVDDQRPQVGGFAVHGGMGSWPAVLDRARYEIIWSPLRELANWSHTWTPSNRSRGRCRTPFGRFAETYLIRKLLMGKTSVEAEQVYGLALPRKYMDLAPVYDGRLSGAQPMGSCSNCQVLISINHGSTLNFISAYGLEVQELRLDFERTVESWIGVT